MLEICDSRSLGGQGDMRVRGVVGPPEFNLDGTIRLRRRGQLEHQSLVIAPLRAAIEGRNVDVVRYLLDEGATGDLHSPDLRPFETPLILAYANLEGGDRRSSTALCEAASSGHLGVVLELLGQGANIHTSNDIALCAAIYRGHVDVVRLLLSKGAVQRSNSLNIAARVGSVELVSLLLDHEADVNAEIARPLRIAVMQNYWNLASFFLEKGADVQVHENEVLWEAVSRGATVAVEEMLKFGANPNALSRYKRKAVKDATDCGFKDTLKLIGIVIGTD
ncbi:hypothetical protein HDU93_009199 [Gonapodya sp. JEL0774]|nr:hypothetical protein HDU93_009199 [Gonapodya sp. JEL0774]